MTDKEKVLEVLNSAIAPMPLDQISSAIKGMSVARVREVVNNIRMGGTIKWRRCEDDRYYTEWWLTEREEELVL